MAMTKSNDVAAELRKALARAQRQGQTLYRIAKLARMHQSQLGRVASGETVPKLDTAERIARAIGCRIIIAPIVAK
jgi:DNA-binding phage protein